MHSKYPQIVVHGIGLFGLETVEKIVQSSRRFPRYVAKNWRKMDDAKANLSLTFTTVADNQFSELKKRTNIIEQLWLPTHRPRRIPRAIQEKMTELFGSTPKHCHPNSILDSLPRLDFLICDLSDPFSNTWISYIGKIPPPNKAIRVILHPSPVNEKITEENKKRFSRSLSYATKTVDTILLTSSIPRNKSPDTEKKRSLNITQVFLQLLQTIAEPGSVNISFHDITHLFERGRIGFVLTISKRGQNIPKVLQDALQRSFFFSLKKIHRVVLGIKGLHLTLKTVNGIIETCKKNFARDAIITWGINHNWNLPARHKTGQVLLIGVSGKARR
ncbi:MAG: hypothetical protein ACTSYO_08360 [Candidatus Ranarchaeia archaeon]